MSLSDRRSPEAVQFRKLYHTARWRNIRKRQLQAFPLCERCLKKGYVVAATVCHHVDPKTKLSSATFYVGPFSSSCAPCHDQTEQQVERIGYSTEVGEDGWPTDENHPSLRG